jgi:hypothetical protein
MARLRFGVSKAGGRAPERLGLTDVSGFRPVDGYDVYRRRIGEPVRERAARDGTAHVSSIGLRSVDRNAFRADNRLMIPRFESVNRKKFGAAQNSSRPFSRLRLRVLPASRRDSRPVKRVYVMSANHHRDVLLGLRSMPASVESGLFGVAWERLLSARLLPFGQPALSARCGHLRCGN